MNSPDLLAALLIGLLGSGHCLGMCGPLAGTIVVASPTGASRNESLNKQQMSVSYNLGRILSYTLAGGAAGLLASVLPALFPAWGGALLRLLAAVLMILLGLYMLRINRWLQQVERIGSVLWRRIQPVASKLLPLRRRREAFVAGALWGWLPCGLVYSALSFSASSGSAASGAAIMLLFGIGTLPAMLGLALLGAHISRFLSSTAFRTLTGSLMIGIGLLTLIFAVRL